MKTGLHLATLSLLLLISGSLRGAQQSKNNPGTQAPGVASASADQMAAKAEAYYDFVMGHYFAQEYQITSRSDDANKSIDSLKKAFALDPSSQQIGDELAEIYYQAQRIRDAVVEAKGRFHSTYCSFVARKIWVLRGKIGDFRNGVPGVLKGLGLAKMLPF